MKNVGVVIVNYNDSINALKLFESIKHNEIISEVVIVDNNSNNIFKHELQSYESENLKVIFSDENKGYAYALNLGAKYLIDKYKDIHILFSNTDILVHDSSVINEMSNSLNNEIKASMVKVKEDGVYNCGWKMTSSFKDLLCNIPFINKLYKNKFIYYKKNYFDNKDREYIDCLYGCFFMVDGLYLKDIGFFDENTFLYFEENILSRKLAKDGKKTIVLLNNYVIHNHNQTIGTNVSRYNKYKIYKKSQFYYEKNYNNATFLEMFFFKLFYYIRLFFLKISCLIKK